MPSTRARTARTRTRKRHSLDIEEQLDLSPEKVLEKRHKQKRRRSSRAKMNVAVVPEAECGAEEVAVVGKEENGVHPRVAATYGRRDRRVAAAKSRRASVALVGGRESLSPPPTEEVGRRQGQNTARNAYGSGDDEEEDGGESAGKEAREESDGNESGDGRRSKTNNALGSFWKNEKAFWDEVDAVSLEEAEDDAP